MKPIAVPSTGSDEARPDGEGETRLSGRWLLVARVAWLALAAFILAVAAASLPLYMAQLHAVSGDGIYIPWQLLPGSAQALSSLGISLDAYAICVTLLSVCLALVWIVVAGVLFWRKSDDWLVLLVALFLLLAGTEFTKALLDPTGWTLRCLNLLFNATSLLVFALFPSGRFVPRWVGWLVLGAIPTTGGDLNFFPASPLNPNTWPAPLGDLWFLSLALCLIGSQLYRYRHVSSPLQRQQIKWVVFALALILLGGIVDAVVGDVLPFFSPLLRPSDVQQQLLTDVVYNLLPILLPLSIGIAILRYHLWDIDVVINRTLVYGLLTLCIVALYVLVVLALGTFFQSRGNLVLSLVATGLVAVLFQPLRDVLQRGVNRLLYGERDEPYQVLTRLGSRLEATLAPEVVLPTIVETVGQALKLPYVAITLREGEASTPDAFFGMRREGESLLCLPLLAQQEQVGELILAPRAPGESFTPTDRRLLEDLTRQIGMAVYAVRLIADLKQLTRDLQHSRERLVTAREEERRRLRRDLHDGLGPQLASLTLKLETARNRLGQDPLADALLADLATRTQAAVADIRRLVYALRPPVLDELGLLSALRELTLQYSDQLSVQLDVPAPLPELSAAIEVALYRIAQEALTNVVRHAQARHCQLHLALEETTGWLVLTVDDDGSGVPASHHVGVGLVSIRERAEELGGAYTIQPGLAGGTQVLVRLPVHPEPVNL